MKKVMSILAVMALGFGMFSCEKSTDQALYENAMFPDKDDVKPGTDTRW